MIPEVDSTTHRWLPADRAFTLTITVCTVGLAIALVAHFAGSDVRRPLDMHIALWPQQWTFFTHLDAESLVAYRWDRSGRLQPVSERRRWGERLGGLRRVRADQAAELRRLALRVPAAWWTFCDGAPVRHCAAREPAAGASAHRLPNDSATPWLCGSSVISVERPAPPGSDRNTGVQRVARAVAVVEVECAERRSG